MKKKMMAKIGALALASMLAVPAFASCKDGSSLANTSIGNADAEYALNIYVYEAGYGKGWIEKAAEEFCKKYPNYQVHITSDKGMFEKVRTELDADKCEADIALMSDVDYSMLASGGHLADLTDIMNSELPESDDLLKDVIPEAHVAYRQLGVGENAKWYGIPWQDNCANGIIYNKGFFEEHHLEIPETMDEYFQLCNAIIDLNTGMYPLVYCGADDYMMNIPNQWLSEYYGYEYMTGTFHKYDNWKYYEDTETGRQKAYDTLAKMLKGEYKGTPYAKPGSEALSADVAQTEFASYTPTAAMYICGPWFPTEEADFLDVLGDDFDYGYFGIPHINANKQDAFGKDSSNVRYSLPSNALVIPQTSQNKAGAKLFLLELYSNYSLSAFVEENNGISRPMTYTPEVSFDTTTKKGKFAQQVYDYFKGTAENPTQLVYEISTAKMASRLAPCNFGDISENIVTNIKNAASYSVAKSKVSGAADRETDWVKTHWDDNATHPTDPNVKGYWNALYLR